MTEPLSAEADKHRKQPCFECGRVECCACSCGNSCEVRATIDQQAERIESLERELEIRVERVKQTTFGDPDGNCFEACLASLAGIPLETIPHYTNDGWFGSYARWLREHGWHLLYWPGGVEEAPMGFAIASGPAERGLDHSTIYFNGALYHDPHPSDAGLVNVNGWMILIRTAALSGGTP